MVIVAAEGLGWSSREAAEGRGPRRVGGAGLKQQESCREEGSGGCCRGAAEARECSAVFSVHSG